MTAIPRFPAFRRLELGDREAIDAIVGRFTPYSDFTFTSLWAWDTDESCAIAMLGENLVVRFKEYESDDHFYSYIGQDDVVVAAEILLAHASEQGLPAQLKLVPEVVIQADSRLEARFAVTPDRDNFDYLYDTTDWATFPSPRFRKHRKRLDRCQQHADLDVRRVDPADSWCQNAMVDLFHRWTAQKPAPEGNHRHELAALKRVFSLDGCNPLSGCGFFDGERLVGFSLWEGLPGSCYAVSHFQKSDRAYPELSSWQAHEVGRFLAAEGYRLLNGEQDLGIPGLRNYKRSLQPDRLLRKYVIAAQSAGRE
jgi:hypothetical protein